jgi:hypothetical protein
VKGAALTAGVRAHWPAAALFAALSIVHTWPLAADPATLSLNANGDAQLNEWILAWVAHRLPRDPVHLFDANIFHREKGSLAFSEPLIVPALLAAPVFWAGGSPVRADNHQLLAGFTLTALAAYAVVLAWTGDRLSSAAAGSLFAFNTHTLTRLPHLQAIHAYGLPLALLCAERLIRQPSWRAALGLALAMSLMVYTSGYLVVFAILMIALVLAARAPEWHTRARAVLGGFALAAIVTALVALPVVIPYRRAALEQGMVRSVENVRQFSATLTGYLAATGRLHASTWSGRFLRNPVDTFFPGFVALALAAFCVWRAARAGTHARRVIMLLLIAAAGVVLSLGTRTPVYGWLFTVFPPMQGLRAAARFGNLFLLAIALLAGLGLALLRQANPGRRGALLAGMAVLLVNVEALRSPLDYRRFEGIPRVYTLLAREPGPVVLAEIPFYPAHAAFENAEYVLNSTAHWRPLLNGYSGYTPASYRRLAWILWYFPREAAIAEMRKAGVTHFMVHPARLGASRAEETLDVLSRRADIELVAVSPGRGPRLYRFR